MEKKYFKCEDLVKIMRLHCNIDSQHGFCYIEKNEAPERSLYNENSLHLHTLCQSLQNCL